MNKNKLIKYLKLVGLVILGVALVAVFIVPKFAASDRSGKSFPKKAADILPTLPVPKLAGDAKTTSQIVFVPRVVDGDTIVVEPVDPVTGVAGQQETVRYIGMDTPETVSPTKPVECYGHEASAENKALVDGQYVAIVRDAGDKDKYGRLLRYVYLLDGTSSQLGTFINLELVEEGYARVLTIPPNTEFKAEFSAAASAAQSARLGFWGACPTDPFQ